MARIKVLHNGKVVSEIPLSEDRGYIAGRKEGVDILLNEDKSISREHFKLYFDAGNWKVEVISRLGEIETSQGAVREMILEHGSVFRVGPYQFEFLFSSADANSGEPVSGNEESPPADDVENSDSTVIGVAPSVPHIKLRDSNGEIKELIRLEAGASWIAGRDSQCSIQIKDQRVSRKQFEIRKEDGQYFIIDLGSINGTLLNGNPLNPEEMKLLKSGDAISVLENYLYFELHDPNFRSRLEMVNLQPAPEAPAENYLVPEEDHSVQDYADEPNEMVSYQGQPPQYMQTQMPPMQQGGYGLPPAGATGGFDWEKNRIRVIIVVIAALAAIFYFTQDDNSSAPPPTAIVPLALDPLAKLTPEQRNQVKQSYQLAETYYFQGKYEFAKAELSKLMAIVPEYEKSKDLAKTIDQALLIQAQKIRQEELEKMKAEQEEKILAKVAECEKKLNPNITLSEMDACISDVVALNPEHVQLQRLRAEVERLVAVKAEKTAKRGVYLGEVAKLKAVYKIAVDLEKSGNLVAAIGAYERVLQTKLPDPEGLKPLSTTKIAQLKKLIVDRSAIYKAEAEKAYADQDLKKAILALRKVKDIDPFNASVQRQIDEYVLELKKLMLVIYQEGILEESFGNVEGSETRPGAKDKWKKIMATDIPDGEFYMKAKLKLKKFGDL